MVLTPVNERTSFPLTIDGSSPEELLQAGKYDWVADYSRRIVHSKIRNLSAAGVEIVLLSPQESGSKSLASVFTEYDPPEVTDALRFGAQYPDEQRKSPIIFPHEPWSGPHGPTFALVLRADENKARGFSYAPYSGLLDDWWGTPADSALHNVRAQFVRIAVRRRGRNPA
jgi:hypothetical protein